MKYPCFCKVWNIGYFEVEVYFAIIVEKINISYAVNRPERYIDHNGNMWDCAVPLTVEELNAPIKALKAFVGSKAYNHLTEPPEEIELNVALNLLRGCQNCED